MDKPRNVDYFINNNHLIQKQNGKTDLFFYAFIQMKIKTNFVFFLKPPPPVIIKTKFIWIKDEI